MINLEVIDNLGKTGDWKFEVFLGDRGDVAVWSGTGVGYIDHLVSTLSARQAVDPRFSYRIETGVKGLSSGWAPCDTTDLAALRAAFVKYHGEVNRVNEWDT